MAVRLLPSPSTWGVKTGDQVAPSGISVYIVSARNSLRSAVGANVQRVGRKGSHYAAKVQLPRMDYRDSMEWLDLRTEVDECALELPFYSILNSGGELGFGRVNGAGQAGAALITDGFEPQTLIPKGSYLNHVAADGRLRLYCVDEARSANDAGQVILPLETMLTYPPADNDVLAFYPPTLQGFVTVDEDLWNVDIARTVGLQFTIEERGT